MHDLDLILCMSLCVLFLGPPKMVHDFFAAQIYCYQLILVVASLNH
jgi:hypothetical protein